MIFLNRLIRCSVQIHLKINGPSVPTRTARSDLYVPSLEVLFNTKVFTGVSYSTYESRVIKFSNTIRPSIDRSTDFVFPAIGLESDTRELRQTMTTTAMRM